MADITMCDNQDCESRNRCYRALAEPSDYQSYAVFEIGSNAGCKFFIEFVPHVRKVEKAIDW